MHVSKSLREKIPQDTVVSQCSYKFMFAAIAWGHNIKIHC